MSELMVFTGNANPELAHKVASHLGVPIGDATAVSYTHLTLPTILLV